MSDYDFYEPPPWGFGSSYSVSSDYPEYDPVEALRAVVEEVTGIPIQRESRKIGFY